MRTSKKAFDEACEFTANQISLRQAEVVDSGVIGIAYKGRENDLVRLYWPIGHRRRHAAGTIALGALALLIAPVTLAYMSLQGAQNPGGQNPYMNIGMTALCTAVSLPFLAIGLRDYFRPASQGKIDLLVQDAMQALKNCEDINPRIVDVVNTPEPVG
jgi:hypothetical protein